MTVEKQGGGQVNNDERQLWHIDGVSCVMISCCSGAELQMRRGDEIVLRELYPSKSDLYERANDLKTELNTGQPSRD
jgi:hypothetical protein